MDKEEWDSADIADASRALDAELDKIFREAMGVSDMDAPEAEENIPEAEILPDDDDDPPEAEIIDDDDGDGDADLRPVPLSRGELAALIEQAVERGLISALKKLGKF